MIIESLVRLANREGLIESPAYEHREVSWRIVVLGDGRFVSLESLIQPPSEDQRGRRARGHVILVPRPFPGAAPTGIKKDAEFLVGNVSFVLGEDISKEQKYAARSGELSRRLGDFRRLIAEANEGTCDVGLAAVASFLSNLGGLDSARAQARQRAAAKELLSNHLIAFRLDGDDTPFVHLRPSVMTYWTGLREGRAAAEEKRQCLVTGAFVPMADKHPPIKNLRGGMPSGVALVSFNWKAAESYGFRDNQNAPVSRPAAEAYTAALNRLLNPAFPDPREPGVRLPAQQVPLSDDTVAVFWTDTASLVPSAIVAAVGEGDPDAMKVLGASLPPALEPGPEYVEADGNAGVPLDASRLRDLHEAPWRGVSPNELADDGAFRLLVLRGVQGRAVVQGFQTFPVRETVLSIRRWFQDLALATLRGKPALYRLLGALAERGDRRKLAPGLASDVFLAALGGHALPLGVLEAAVRRCRSESGNKVPPERAALIKAYLNRARLSVSGDSGIEFKLGANMNKDERNRGYLLGRLFACAERMQELALGEVGASVADRYFSAACATPQAVFPRLLKGEIHHFRKAREGKWGGSARWLQNEIGSLASWLVAEANEMRSGESLEALLHRTAGRDLRGFPAFLPLVEQGLFTLGYHQQRAEFFRRRERNEPTEMAESVETV